MRKWDPINDRQLRLLRRIADGESIDFAAENAMGSLRAIRDRGLATLRQQQGRWEASITDAGKFYLAHGYHPAKPERAIQKASETRQAPHSTDKGSTPHARQSSRDIENGEFPLDKVTKRELDALFRGLDVPSLAFTLQQAARASSVSSPLLMDAIHGRRDDLPRLPAKRAGDRYLINALELLRWIDRLPDA